MSLAKKLVWRQLREHTSYRARRILNSRDKKKEISRLKGSIHVVMLIFPASAPIYFSLPEHLNDTEEYASPSTCTWVHSRQAKATPFHKHTNSNMEERGLREKCKWHGQQNNVALSGERTHKSWSEMIFQCTTLPCMAWRGTVGILNLAKYQNALNAWGLARSSLCKPHAKLIIFYSQTYCTALLHSISTKMGIISRIYLKINNNNMKPDTWLRVCCWSSLNFTST